MFVEVTIQLEDNNKKDAELIIVADFEFEQGPATDSIGMPTEMGTMESIDIDYVVHLGLEFEGLKALYMDFDQSYDFDTFIEILEDSVSEKAHNQIKKEADYKAETSHL